MGYVSEPKNIDLVVGPSTLTEDTKQNIANAIARYKKTGEKPANNGVNTQNSLGGRRPTSRSKSIGV